MSTVCRAACVAVAVALALSAAEWEWTLPPGFPRPPVPADNPMSKAKVELGRHLFYDRRMSINGKQSCASCHRQELAFTDGRARAEGATGQTHPRSSMSLVNVAYAPALTWANPVLDSLEEQALVPMLGDNPVELGLNGREQAFLDVVKRDPVYQRLFPAAFPDENRFTLQNITRAVAAFERSIVSMRSPYDRYRWAGELRAISDAAKRGEILFFSSERAACFRCHGGWNFSAVRFEGNLRAVPKLILRGSDVRDEPHKSESWRESCPNPITGARAVRRFLRSSQDRNAHSEKRRSGAFIRPIVMPAQR